MILEAISCVHYYPRPHVQTHAHLHTHTPYSGDLLAPHSTFRTFAGNQKSLRKYLGRYQRRFYLCIAGGITCFDQQTRTCSELQICSLSSELDAVTGELLKGEDFARGTARFSKNPPTVGNERVRSREYTGLLDSSGSTGRFSTR